MSTFFEGSIKDFRATADGSPLRERFRTVMRDYTRIYAWQLADDLAVDIYALTRGFPKEERYGLTRQVRRAAYSVPANIAEGSARRTKRDYVHFLHIALGSLAECQYFVHLSCRLGYLEPTDGLALKAQIKRVFACVQKLIAAVSREV